jgi:hypothetical protein
MTTDRKALIRQYKLTPRSMGVGAVRNTTSDKALVVAGRDLSALLNRHQAQLRLNAHGNRALQADWNTLGPGAFKFVVLDTLTPKDAPDYDPTEDLRTLEDLWLEKLNPFEPTGYHHRKERAAV